MFDVKFKRASMPLCEDEFAPALHHQSPQSGVSVTQVDRYLTLFSRSLELRRAEHGRCRACGEDRLVFSLHGSLN